MIVVTYGIVPVYWSCFIEGYVISINEKEKPGMGHIPRILKDMGMKSYQKLKDQSFHLQRAADD